MRLHTVLSQPCLHSPETRGKLKMKKGRSRLGAYLLSGLVLTAVVTTPILGSAANLSSSPFGVKAAQLDGSGKYAIRGLNLKAGTATPGDTTSPSSNPTSTPSPSSPPTTAPAAPVYPKPTAETEFTWSVEPDGTAKLTGLRTESTVTDVVIPQTATVSGVSRIVTAVNQSAASNRNLTSVVIPDSVKTIGSYAFSGNKLTSINIPSSMTTIDSNVFSGNQLNTLTIPDTITSINFSAFQNNLLTSVVFSSNLTSIGDSAFDHNALTAINLPESLTSLGSYAFRYNKLASLSIPSKITAIKTDAFRFNSITSLSLPTGLKSIGDSAFGSNTDIAKVVIPSTVTSIGTSSFYLPNLKAIYMEGDAPTTFTAASASGASFGTGKTVYYKAGASGYTNPWKGYPTATY